MPATEKPQFDVARFDSPTPEMPTAIREAMTSFDMIAFRGTTEDGRVAWVPVRAEALDEVRGLETEVRTMLADALRNLEQPQ
jgi:hypothetical protein